MVTAVQGIKSRAFLTIFLLTCSVSASAQLTNQGVLDQVVAEFNTRASSWQTVVMSAASWLFWTLGTISFTWTMGMLALRKADMGDFFAEFIRFILFFGFFYWLLQNGPTFADSIIRSLRQLGDSAAGTSGLSPTVIVDIGFLVFKRAIENISLLNPVDSIAGLAMSVAILLLLATIAVNMLLLLVSAWILMYAGIFFLGFGGARWTSDMAINYYKTVLSVAVQLFAMILLVGIGTDLLDTFYAQMSTSLKYEELGTLLVVCFALLMLVNRIPSLLASIITGASIGGAGIGNVTAGVITGAAIGAAGTASAAASLAGSAAMGGALNIAGGASAIRAAFQKSQANLDSGPMPSLGALDGGSSGGESVMSAVGHTPFARAAGFASRAPADNSMARLSPASTSRSTGRPSSGSNAKGGPGSTGGLARAASLAVGTTAELAKGTLEVAKGKVASVKGAARERVAQTPGGQIAAAIKGQGRAGEADMLAPEPSGSLTFGDNRLSSANAREVDPESEIAAFRDRDKPPQGKQA